MKTSELKKEMQKLGVKHYYTMKRKEMLPILRAAAVPQKYVIEKMTIHELRDEAKRRGLRGFWQLRRDALVKWLYPEFYHGDVHEAAADKNEKNKGNTNKHDAPEQHGAENIRVEDLEDRLDNIKLNV